jgi:hypothetical protein
LVARRAEIVNLGEIAMDSELTTKISDVVFQLAAAEKQRLEAAGTFVELEELATEIGDEVTRQLMNQQLVDRSNETAESVAGVCCPDCGSPGSPGDPVHRELQSTRGELSYHEPSFHCHSCRRSFFPSGRSDGITNPSHRDPQDD